MYTVVFSLCGLLMGYLTDKYSRKWILSISALLWNVLTGLSYFSNSFISLLISRMLVGLFSSSNIIASFSLINDYFDHDSRGRANGIFYFGAYIGACLSSLTLILD
jgi:MFS family permease